MALFDVGKLPLENLQRLLAGYQIKDPRVVVGPRIGEDAAVIDFGETYLVAKTDPITFATDRIAWYTVNINANDIATMGAQPKWLLVSALLPEGQTDESLVEGLFHDLTQSCDELGLALCGGHTEITYDLNRPILVGLMLGEVAKDKLVTNDRAREGDEVILTKGIAIEGTAILAREKAAELEGRFEPALLERARNLLTDPGISVVKDALTANEVTRVHAMHDPTEGGLASGLRELALAADRGVLVDRAKIEVLHESARLCEHFELDPLGLIASGSLLIAVDRGDSSRVIDALREQDVDAAVIGRITEKGAGMKMKGPDGIVELPTFATDEIAKVF